MQPICISAQRPQMPSQFAFLNEANNPAVVWARNLIALCIACAAVLCAIALRDARTTHAVITVVCAGLTILFFWNMSRKEILRPWRKNVEEFTRQTLSLSTMLNHEGRKWETLSEPELRECVRKHLTGRLEQLQGYENAYLDARGDTVKQGAIFSEFTSTRELFKRELSLCENFGLAKRTDYVVDLSGQSMTGSMVEANWKA